MWKTVKISATNRRIKKVSEKVGIKFRSIFRRARVHPCISYLKRIMSPFPSFATMFLDLGANLAFEKIKFTLADIDIF